MTCAAPCRTTEIELALEGEVPVPKRSGRPLLQDIEPVHSAREDTSHATSLHQPEHSRGDVRGRDSMQSSEGYSEQSKSSTKTKQPTLKRSKALSRPLADVTKMVNLASLVEDEDNGAKFEKSKAEVQPRSRQTTDTAYSPYGQAPTHKLQVYRDDEVPRSSATHHSEVSSAFECTLLYSRSCSQLKVSCYSIVRVKTLLEISSEDGCDAPAFRSITSACERLYGLGGPRTCHTNDGAPLDDCLYNSLS
jgi:hypothetical protein